MNLDKIDLHYRCVDIDYHTEYDCENNGCNDEGICRCGSIYDAVVTNVDISQMVNLIYDELFDSSTVLGKREDKLNQLLYGIGEDINRYTIDRVLRKYKIWEPDNFDVEVCGGYYGQEIEGTFIIKNISDKIETELDIAFSIEDLSGRVEYLLGLEYGSLLPELENCQYEIIELDKSEINFGAIEHHSKVKKKDLEFYSDKNYKGIRGVVTFSRGKYRLIDGYHRVHTTAGHKVKVLKAFK
jgi:hypothetical protein